MTLETITDFSTKSGAWISVWQLFNLQRVMRKVG